jgi:hypothetical protein
MPTDLGVRVFDVIHQILTRHVAPADKSPSAGGVSDYDRPRVVS